MTINFIGYLDPFHYNGGAELSYRMLIQCGRRKGHQINIFARRTGKLSKYFAPNLDSLPPADLYMLADVFNCPEAKRPLDFHILKRVVENERYIHIEGAWVDICHKAYFPCNGNLARCPDVCSLERARWLYRHALACTFGSPLHHRIARQILGDDVIRNAIIIRPVVDTSVFYNRHLERDIEYLYVGTVAAYKGYSEIKKRFVGRDMVFVGRNLTGEELIGRHVGHISHQKTAAYYNRAKYFVHLPQWIEIQGRAVVEAALCGCRLITNDNVGALTFDFDIAEPNNIAAAGDIFWNDVERYV